jgi:hypothetical protein
MGFELRHNIDCHIANQHTIPEPGLITQVSDLGLRTTPRDMSTAADGGNEPISGSLRLDQVGWGSVRSLKELMRLMGADSKEEVVARLNNPPLPMANEDNILDQVGWGSVRSLKELMRLMGADSKEEVIARLNNPPLPMANKDNIGLIATIDRDRPPPMIPRSINDFITDADQPTAPTSPKNDIEFTASAGSDQSPPIAPPSSNALDNSITGRGCTSTAVASDSISRPATSSPLSPAPLDSDMLDSESISMTVASNVTQQPSSSHPPRTADVTHLDGSSNDHVSSIAHLDHDPSLVIEPENTVGTDHAANESNDYGNQEMDLDLDLCPNSDEPPIDSEHTSEEDMVNPSSFPQQSGDAPLSESIVVENETAIGSNLVDQGMNFDVDLGPNTDEAPIDSGQMEDMVSSSSSPQQSGDAPLSRAVVVETDSAVVSDVNIPAVSEDGSKGSSTLRHEHPGQSTEAAKSDNAIDALATASSIGQDVLDGISACEQLGHHIRRDESSRPSSSKSSQSLTSAYLAGIRTVIESATRNHWHLDPSLASHQSPPDSTTSDADPLLPLSNGSDMDDHQMEQDVDDTLATERANSDINARSDSHVDLGNDDPGNAPVGPNQEITVSRWTTRIRPPMGPCLIHEMLIGENTVFKLSEGLNSHPNRRGHQLGRVPWPEYLVRGAKAKEKFKRLVSYFSLISALVLLLSPFPVSGLVLS